jgi:hypothetical protein
VENLDGSGGFAPRPTHGNFNQHEVTIMKRIALSLIASGVLIAGYASQASATSPYTGCPSSYHVWNVGSQTPPYHADEAVDEKGNDDNIVCAKQIDNKTFQYNNQTYPLYNFIDNTVAPGS